MATHYESRLALMEAWYREALGSSGHEQSLLDEYRPHATFLANLNGAVLDVGGGAGLTARFLQSDVRYVVVDPLELWTSPDWSAFSKRFREKGPEPEFLKAEGENLPLADESFDAVVSFWSLNHVRSPEKCIKEMLRVLKAGGIARIVFEDMEPSWPDLFRDAARRLGARIFGKNAKAQVAAPVIDGVWMKLTGVWKVEEDHLPIAEHQLIQWLADAEIDRREWIDGYLTFDFRKASA